MSARACRQTAVCIGAATEKRFSSGAYSGRTFEDAVKLELQPPPPPRPVCLFRVPPWSQVSTVLPMRRMFLSTATAVQLYPNNSTAMSAARRPPSPEDHHLAVCDALQGCFVLPSRPGYRGFTSGVLFRFPPHDWRHPKLKLPLE